MTSEQKKLQADLVAEYGEPIVRQAQELSGIALCIHALAAGMGDSPRADFLRRQASLHLAQLLDTTMQPSVAAKVTECARRMDAALDVWVADEIEEREGLTGNLRPAAPLS